MRRVALGIIGLFLLVGGLGLALAGVDAPWANLTVGVLIKTGAVTLLFWLAYHQLVRLFEVVPPWIFGAGLIGLGIVVAAPRSLFVVLCVFAALVALHVVGMLLAPFAARQRGNSAKRPATGASRNLGAKRKAKLKTEVPDLKSQRSNFKSQIPNQRS
jgi:hypothetical protein